MAEKWERKAIDDKAVRDAGDVKRSETNLIESLQLVDRYRVYEDFDLTSLFSYCTERLGLSEDRACTYIQVARKAVEFPALKQALQQNEFSLSHAKKLTKVITAETESLWLERATTLSTRELENLRT